MVENEALLCAELKGLDHTDGEGSVGLGKSKVGGRVVDAV